MNELEVKTSFLEQLKTLLPQVDIRSVESNVVLSNKCSVDAILNIKIGSTSKTLVIEIKSSGEPRRLREAITYLKTAIKQVPGGYPVVVVPYINQTGREICMEQGIGFIDLNGNILLSFDSVYIERFGKRDEKVARKRLKRLFSSKSSRIARIMLENPNKAWRQIDLAEEASVSIGLVNLVVGVLEAQEIIERAGIGKILLRNPTALLDNWVKVYDLSVNTASDYYLSARTPDQVIKKISEAASIKKKRYAFTVHAGASLVAPFVRFQHVHLYTEGDIKLWQDFLGLREVEFGGNVSLLSPYDEGVFYNRREINGIEVVGDIQLYLDLYSYPARGREQADFLRQQRLSF